MASKKDGDVEAVGKLAKQTSPEQLAEIDALLADYRARRAADKRAAADAARARLAQAKRSEEHTSELQSLMRISYAVFCLKIKISVPPRNTNLTIQLYST